MSAGEPKLNTEYQVFEKLKPRLVSIWKSLQIDDCPS